MTKFLVWAPFSRAVEVQLGGQLRALRLVDGQGWWEVDLPQVGPVSDYAYVLDGGQPLPDPRSRWQPYGVHSSSRLVDFTSFPWTDHYWRGIPLAGSIIYELHIGTFTPEGTFGAAISRLDHLVELGIDLIELLPVHAFPGRRGWGYDGVDLYAVQDAYGGPSGLARFIDACHAKKLGVILDVVYNHLGPSGNYLSRFGPYFTPAATGWGGDSLNYFGPKSDEVRAFVIENALMWLRDYHCDGLRLDAVHAIVDMSAVHLLEQLAIEVEALSAHLGRELLLIAESDLNDPQMVGCRQCGGLGMDAQWSDDLHHAIFAALTGAQNGYYCDFGRLADIAAAYERGFVYDGRYSRYRHCRHGRRLSDVPSFRLLGYLQNHDQVGNRPGGERASHLMNGRLLKVGAALVLLSPFTPMLFMGEEWGASTPWQYFTDHSDPGLADIIWKGRQAELAELGWDSNEVPDPQHLASFERSKLDWAEIDTEPHAGLLDWYRRLIALRRALPAITDPRLPNTVTTYDERARWLIVDRGGILIVCNFSTETRAIALPPGKADVLLTSSQDVGVGNSQVMLGGEAVVVLRLHS